MALDPKTVNWAAFKTNDLVVQYAKLTTLIEEAEANYKAKMAGAKAGQAAIKNEIRARMNQDGIDNISVTGFGTAFFVEKITPSVSNWPKLHEHLAGRLKAGAPLEDVFGAFQRRVTKEWVTNYQEDHEGVPPPGVEVSVERDLQVRRLSSKS